MRAPPLGRPRQSDPSRSTGCGQRCGLRRDSFDLFVFPAGKRDPAPSERAPEVTCVRAKEDERRSLARCRAVGRLILVRERYWNIADSLFWDLLRCVMRRRALSSGGLSTTAHRDFGGVCRAPTVHRQKCPCCAVLPRGAPSKGATGHLRRRHTSAIVTHVVTHSPGSPRGKCTRPRRPQATPTKPWLGRRREERGRHDAHRPHAGWRCRRCPPALSPIFSAGICPGRGGALVPCMIYEH